VMGTLANAVGMQHHRAGVAHLYGPSARCKPKSDDLEKLVLRFCIRPSL
jgi:hypothetical protein